MTFIDARPIVTVASLNATSPGGVTGCVHTVETAPDSWTEEAWFKDDKQVAFRSIETDGSGEQGYHTPE